MLSQKRRCTLCIIEHFGNADAVPQPPERCLSRQVGIVRCCPNSSLLISNCLRPTPNSSLLTKTGVFTMLLPLLMTTIAGLSTGLGGLIAALFRPTPRLMAFCGGFAGAVMLTVSLADLAPALLDFYGALLSPFGCGAAAAALLLGGMLAAWLLACALPDEDTLADRFGSRTQGSAMRAALVTGAALLLHNLPEGILTLLTNVSDPQLGARTALAIALHNIPEGLAVAVPFACATGSRAKGAVAALVSGLAEPAGAVLAALVLAPLLTPGLLNGIVAVVAGIMLWVAAAQLLPAAFEPAWRKMGVTGFCVGVLMMILGIAALA